MKDIFPPATGGVDPADIAAIWARLNSDQGNILRPIDITLIKQMVLGSDMHDVNHMLRSITGQLIWNDLHNRYSRDKVHIELFYKDGNSALYEAADLDGASGWQRFRYVTWPELRSTTQ